MPPDPDGNAVSDNALARVLGSGPAVPRAPARLDNEARCHGRLPLDLNEAVRRAVFRAVMGLEATSPEEAAAYRSVHAGRS
jgi:hypothetical protein